MVENAGSGMLEPSHADRSRNSTDCSRSYDGVRPGHDGGICSSFIILEREIRNVGTFVCLFYFMYYIFSG